MPRTVPRRFPGRWRRMIRTSTPGVSPERGREGLRPSVGGGERPDAATHRPHQHAAIRRLGRRPAGPGARRDGPAAAEPAHRGLVRRLDAGGFGHFPHLPARAARPEIAADAGPPLPPDQVPLPRARPAPSPARRAQCSPSLRKIINSRHACAEIQEIQENRGPAGGRIASLAASLLSGRRSHAGRAPLTLPRLGEVREGARRQRCGPTMER